MGVSGPSRLGVHQGSECYPVWEPLWWPHPQGLGKGQLWAGALVAPLCSVCVLVDDRVMPMVFRQSSAQNGGEEAHQAGDAGSLSPSQA